MQTITPTVVTVEFTQIEAQLLEYFLNRKGYVELADRIKDARFETVPPVQETTPCTKP